jgi:hypothetical protein
MLIRVTPFKRDRVLLEVAYTGGLRVSERVALTWTTSRYLHGRTAPAGCASIQECFFDEDEAGS